MCPSIHIFNRDFPTYGLMMVLGLVVANIIGICIVKKRKMQWLDFIIIEAYTLLGAGFGAKILYLIVSFNDIEWSRFLELEYFNQLMQGGFVFYGGLIGGLACWVLAGKLHKLPYREFAKQLLFLIPLVHGFGRIGCFLAGCCYGIPYDGFGAVHFPEGAFAPTNESLFPVQLIEAIGLFIIALLMYLLKKKNESFSMLTFYMFSYGILRFVLEFFRYDSARGSLWVFSTSQWISILLVVAAIAMVIIRKKDYLNK